MVLIFPQWRAAYDLCCTLLDSEVKGISITTWMGKQSRHCSFYKMIQSFTPVYRGLLLIIISEHYMFWRGTREKEISVQVLDNKFGG